MAKKRRDVHFYRCAHCHRVYERQSTKAWIKSWCERGGRFARLVRLKGL